MLGVVDQRKTAAYTIVTKECSPLQIDLRSNYERKSDGIGYLMKHAEIVGKRQNAPPVQVP